MPYPDVHPDVHLDVQFIVDIVLGLSLGKGYFQKRHCELLVEFGSLEAEGSFWDSFRTRFGLSLDSLWTLFGLSLDSLWTLFGLNLSKCQKLDRKPHQQEQQHQQNNQQCSDRSNMRLPRQIQSNNLGSTNWFTKMECFSRLWTFLFSTSLPIIGELIEPTCASAVLGLVCLGECQQPTSRTTTLS